MSSVAESTSAINLGAKSLLVTVSASCGVVLDPHPSFHDVGAVRVLPLRPIWPGFAINTIFYAAILWMLFAAPMLARRKRRIKRGLCPACAYPVGTSAVCTECGEAVP